METDWNEFESLLKRLGSREQVCVHAGYFPAWKVWYLKSTFGLPLVVIAFECYKRKLKIDWRGVRYEATKEGSNVDGEVIEAQRELRLLRN